MWVSRCATIIPPYPSGGENRGRNESSTAGDRPYSYSCSTPFPLIFLSRDWKRDAIRLIHLSRYLSSPFFLYFLACKQAIHLGDNVGGHARLVRERRKGSRGSKGYRAPPFQSVEKSSSKGIHSEPQGVTYNLESHKLKHVKAWLNFGSRPPANITLFIFYDHAF